MRIPTRTPWIVTVDKWHDTIVAGPAFEKIAGEVEKRDADRIVACVNACADMDDPAAIISGMAVARDTLAAVASERDQLRAENARLRGALANMTHYAGYALDYLIGTDAIVAEREIKEAEALMNEVGHE